MSAPESMFVASALCTMVIQMHRTVPPFSCTTTVLDIENGDICKKILLLPYVLIDGFYVTSRSLCHGSRLPPLNGPRHQSSPVRVVWNDDRAPATIFTTPAHAQVEYPTNHGYNASSERSAHACWGVGEADAQTHRWDRKWCLGEGAETRIVF